MGRAITIGMAALDAGRNGDVIITLGLGSCVGVTLYDPLTHIGGMVHVMLPACNPAMPNINRAKFADTGVEELYRKVLSMGASQAHLQAKMAGGAHMFSKVMQQDVIKVGVRNADMCREVLRRMRIPIRIDDTGGTYGRTIELNTATGELTIKTIGHGVKVV